MPGDRPQPLKRFDSTFTTAAENLALDEAILEGCEAGRGGDTLIFWEPTSTFVVVGYANKVQTEVNTAACAARGIPIYRRCSGGGTIVQMPGGLNYSVILEIGAQPGLKSITSANQFIMETNRQALAPLLKPEQRGLISVKGHTDLCLGQRKFAGNSQRRSRVYLLFHGTILLNCDLNLIGELLQMPSAEPEYRARRSHPDFLTNLNLPAADVKEALARAWKADALLEKPPLEEIKQLARTKYESREWNEKF